MTEAIYLEVSEKTEAAKKAGRRVSVSGMLKFLGVSRLGYHAWLHRMPSDTKKRREAIKAKIQDIYDASKQNYGAPQITVELRKNGEIISERTVGTYMRQMGIRTQWSKPWTITTKDSDFSTELQNILDEHFNPDRPNAVWCSDITYIRTIDGFVYLTSIMDLFSRKIIAWTLSETLEVSCVIDTINKAKARRNIDQPLIIHSDRGSQYVAKEYKKATENMQRSYSKKAFPWDNACIESFHSIIKREWFNRFKIRDYKQTYQLIFEYLEAFYNRATPASTRVIVNADTSTVLTDTYVHTKSPGFTVHDVKSCFSVVSRKLMFFFINRIKPFKGILYRTRFFHDYSPPISSNGLLIPSRVLLLT